MQKQRTHTNASLSVLILFAVQHSVKKMFSFIFVFAHRAIDQIYSYLLHIDEIDESCSKHYRNGLKKMKTSNKNPTERRKNCENERRHFYRCFVEFCTADDHVQRTNNASYCAVWLPFRQLQKAFRNTCHIYGNYGG